MPTVLITGAGRGLGLEFARQYAAEGWRVLGTVRDPRSGAALASLGRNAEVHLADMADRGAIARLGRDLAGVPIDVLICNAGIYGPRGFTLGHTDYAEYEQVLRVNMLAPLACVEALAANVAASAQRKIVMMSSGLASMTNSGRGSLVYNSSKAGLNSIAVSLAHALRERGIIVVPVSPGWNRTDMGGAEAPLDPVQSIRSLRGVIAGLTPERSGAFLNYDGTPVPW